MTVPLDDHVEDLVVSSLAGSSVERVAFDHAVTFTFDAGDGTWELRVECPAVVTSSVGGETLLVPESRTGASAALDLLHTDVVDVTAFRDGALRVTLDDERRLGVPADEAYEAWTLTGPAGAMLVSLPGGELAIWGFGT